jgi:hypothetical protein
MTAGASDQMSTAKGWRDSLVSRQTECIWTLNIEMSPNFRGKEHHAASHPEWVPPGIPPETRRCHPTFAGTLRHMDTHTPDSRKARRRSGSAATTGLACWHPQRDSNPCRHLERVAALPAAGTETGDLPDTSARHFPGRWGTDDTPGGDHLPGDPPRSPGVVGAETGMTRRRRVKCAGQPAGTRHAAEPVTPSPHGFPPHSCWTGSPLPHPG